MIDGLKQTVLLFLDLRIKHADYTVIASAEEQIIPRGVEIQSSDLIVDLSVLPS